MRPTAKVGLTKRFVDRDAVFHFIEPFDIVRFGTPFDMPGANVRRTSTRSATEVVLANMGVRDQKLEALARMAGLAELSPWMMPTDTAASQLAERIRGVAESACGRGITTVCLPNLLQDLDEWYQSRPTR